MLGADEVCMRHVQQVGKTTDQRLFVVMDLLVRAGDLPQATHEVCFALLRKSPIDEVDVFVQRHAGIRGIPRSGHQIREIMPAQPPVTGQCIMQTLELYLIQAMIGLGDLDQQCGRREVQRCRVARGVRFVSDEIYHGITFGKQARTAADLDGDPIVVNSFSKYFSMTGWRLGWTILPTELVTPVERLAQNLTIAPSTIAQLAARAAFGCHDELGRNVEVYRLNRATLLDALPSMGFTRLAPADGAFYIWADVSHLCDDSQELCKTWLDDLGVAVTPGVDFDPIHGHRHVRFSYAGTSRDMSEAIDRIGGWLDVQR